MFYELDLSFLQLTYSMHKFSALQVTLV